MKPDVDPNIKNIFNDQWTALHYAAQEGYLELIKILVEKYQV
jgi:ankyrin repeat protein